MSVSICCSRSHLRAAPDSDPVQVKRARQRKRVPATQQPPALQKYDFGGQLRILQDPTAMDPQKLSALAAAPGAKPDADGKAPKGYQPRTDVPLSSTAMEAVRVSETWRGGQNTPAAGSDGRVLYAYGAGLANRRLCPSPRLHD